jgi:hypothetical protein
MLGTPATSSVHSAPSPKEIETSVVTSKLATASYHR